MKKHKIAVIGPESTGKTVLVRRMADHFNCAFVAEFARHYIAALDRRYVYDDILEIAKKQKELEKEAFSRTERLLICDSSMITNKVWSYDKFGKCDDWIEHEMNHECYDLFLLCYPDLPWQPDPLREDKHRRMYLFKLYEQFLKEKNKTYQIISGFGDMRTEKAISYIDQVMVS